jgi:Ricin-type beta-trefoil lectin domain-like
MFRWAEQRRINPSTRLLQAVQSQRRVPVELLEPRVLLVGNPIPNGTYNLANGASGLYLDDTKLTSTAASDATAPNSGAIMDQNTGDLVNPVFGRDEMWQLTYNGAGYYTIVNINSGLYLEDYQGSTTKGVPLYEDNSDGGTDQLWSLTASGSSYIITNDASGLIIDDTGSSTSAGTNQDLWIATGGTNQNWNFTNAAIAADGVYTLQNGKSGKYLDNPGSSNTTGIQMVQNSSNGGYDQAWFFNFNGAGFYTIQNVASGLYMEDPGGSTTPGVALEQGAADGAADELWSLTPNGSSYIITNKQTGLVFDDFNNSTSSGAPVDLYTANNGSNQNWTFLSTPVIDSGIYTLTNGKSAMLLDDPGSSTASGTQIVQNPSNSGRDQDWQFNYNGTGFYTIQNDISGLYLEDPGGSTTPGAVLEQAAADGGNDQLWYPMASGSSLMMFNLAGGLVIDDTANATTAGAGMDLWTVNRGSNQSWALSQPPLVYVGANGQLAYLPDASGNVIPNYSSVGYETGDVPLPDTAGGVAVPVMETVNPGASGVDMTTTIQNAVNAVQGMALQSNGYRGAVLLTAGNYPISGTINITASGVVLEGQGNNQTTGTSLEATGTSQRLLINISGSGGYSTVSNTTHSITDTYVPEGATSFDVDSTSNLSVGQTVIVSGYTNQAWVNAIGMNELNNPWSPGTGSQTYYRVITAISGNKITINAPITNYIAQQYGGGAISAYTWSGLISNDGMENIYAYSDSTGSSDTNHATGVLNVNDAQNVYVNNITSNGFASNHIVLGTVLYSTFTNMTIENTSINADPPSGVLTTGQFILVENSTFINAYHSIAVNGGEGPNVFYNLTATGTTAQVGPHQRWSTGSLFDNNSITTNQLGVTNRANGGSGQGWAGAFYVFWNDMNAAEIDSFNPPTATNWVIGGSAGAVNAPGHGDGQADVPGDFVDFGSAVSPQSLYFTQLLDRETPTVATAAAANPTTVTGKTTALSVLGADVAGESALTYTWSTTSVPSGAPAVTFSSNGSNASKNTTATFGKQGSYTFSVLIQFPGGFSVTSNVSVSVNLALNTITVTPGSMVVPNGQTQSFSASATDQFGNAVSTTFTWSIDNGGGGSINSSTGVYTAPSTGVAGATVRATSGSISGSAAVTIQLTTIIGTSGNDVIRLASNSTTLSVYINNPTTRAYAAPLSSLGSLTILGEGGSDQIILDSSAGGSPVPAGGLVIDDINGSATLSFAGSSSSDALTLAAGAFTIPAPTAGAGIVPIALSSLTVSSSATLALSSAISLTDRNVLVLGSFSNTARLDLGANDMIVRSASVTTLTNQIASGYTSGTWSGTTGIVSSAAAADPTALHTLGVLGVTSTTTFDNQTANNGDVLVKYTYYGDADLNGKVDGNDYSLIDYGYAHHLTGWSNGDFNYDHSIDGSDYALIDNAFNSQSPIGVPMAITVPTDQTTTTFETASPIVAPAVRTNRSNSTAAPTPCNGNIFQDATPIPFSDMAGTNWQTIQMEIFAVRRHNGLM